MYIGVKYIGKNESKEDTICNTGAVWANGEVLNFEEESAKKLAVHTDSFALVDMSPDSKTFSNKAANKAEEYEPFPSLSGMDKEQIAKLASVRYGIKIETEGREHQDVVFDALNRIKAATLRADAISLGVEVLPVVSLTVTDAEYKDYIAGKLELKLLPVGAAKAPRMLSAEAQSEAVEALKDSAPTSGITVTAETTELPNLPELLASLSTKKELQELAKENGVTYANSMTEAQLRAKLLRELTE